MLQIGEWAFSVDTAQSYVALTPTGGWSLRIQCERKKVKTSDGLTETLAPKFAIDGLQWEPDGGCWRDLTGLELFQTGAWQGEDEPEASMFVCEPCDVYETNIAVVGHEGTSLQMKIDGSCDVFVDDVHDADVAFIFDGALPVRGVQFRFQAIGANSRDPEGHAKELFARNFSLGGFEEPELKKLGAGTFSVLFRPCSEVRSMDDADPQTGSVDMNCPPEIRILRNSANELLSGMLQHGWLELEGDKALPSLVPGFVDVLEMGGRGSRRASRVVDWLIDQDGVVEVHVTDDDLGAVLDKYW